MWCDTWEFASLVLVKALVNRLSIVEQKSIRFGAKYFHLCFKNDQKSHGFKTTWGWANDDSLFMLRWINSLNVRARTNSSVLIYSSQAICISTECWKMKKWHTQAFWAMFVRIIDTCGHPKISSKNLREHLHCQTFTFQENASQSLQGFPLTTLSALDIQISVGKN